METIYKCIELEKNSGVIFAPNENNEYHIIGQKFQKVEDEHFLTFNKHIGNSWQVISDDKVPENIFSSNELKHIYNDTSETTRFIWSQAKISNIGMIYLAAEQLEDYNKKIARKGALLIISIIIIVMIIGLVIPNF